MDSNQTVAPGQQSNTVAQHPVSSGATLSTTASSQQETGVKTAVIATVINIILTFLLFHTYNFNILLAGLYLGFSKGVGPKTKLIFYLANFVFFFLDDALFKNGLNDPERGPVGGVLVTAMSSAMLAAIPLGLMWAIRKIKKS